MFRQVPDGMYTAEPELTLSVEMIKAFRHLAKVNIGEKNNWKPVPGQCLEVNTTLASIAEETCHWSGHYGFCCHEMYLGGVDDTKRVSEPVQAMKSNEQGMKSLPSHSEGKPQEPCEESSIRPTRDGECGGIADASVELSTKMSLVVVATEPRVTANVTDCINLNKLSRRKRVKECKRWTHCQLIGSRCTPSGPSTAPPTLVKEHSCESISASSMLTKEEARTECEGKLDQSCRFIEHSANSAEYKCVTMVDKKGAVSCTKVNEYFSLPQRREACKELGHCEFDTTGKNKGGKCFEFSACSGAENFGIRKKKKQYCTHKLLNRGLNCVFDNAADRCIEYSPRYI